LGGRRISKNIMLSLVYFLGCALFATATSTTHALLETAEASISASSFGIAAKERAVGKRETLLQHARRSSLSERVRRVRASSDDYVESARLLADRTDSLSHRTERLLEKHKEEQQRTSQEGLIASRFRLRKNKPSMEITLEGCDEDMCTSICISDCNVLCSNAIFADRHSDCENCESTCESGCNNDSCKYKLAAMADILS